MKYCEGMKESELIISINNDDNNKLFDMSHYTIKGDIYEVIPYLTDMIKAIK